MREIAARVVADSISTARCRLTTLELVMPRFLLPELNTHRAFSRNSASNRARSVKKTIQEVREDPFVPTYWPSECAGMAGGADIHGLDRIGAQSLWRAAASAACDNAEALTEDSVHKSIVNRLLEPFMWHVAVVTATDWDNFFAQRLAALPDGRPAAEPHFYELAEKMRIALDASTPVELAAGQWHLPYVTQDDVVWAQTTYQGPIDILRRLAVARCAGVSYLNQDAQRDRDRDLSLYSRLAQASPPHWSPFEHAATPANGHTRHFANFRGWQHLRYILEIMTAAETRLTTSDVR